jgi:hypothetical protein
VLWTGSGWLCEAASALAEGRLEVALAGSKEEVVGVAGLGSDKGVAFGDSLRSTRGATSDCAAN